MRTATRQADSLGDTRTVRKFLLLPRHFGRDWRWLEYADIVERYKYISGLIDTYAGWEEVDFADNITDRLNKQDKGTVVKILEITSINFYSSKEALVNFQALMKDSTTIRTHSWVTILANRMDFDCRYWLDTTVENYLCYLINEHHKKEMEATTAFLKRSREDNNEQKAVNEENEHKESG